MLSPYQHSQNFHLLHWPRLVSICCNYVCFPEQWWKRLLVTDQKTENTETSSRRKQLMSFVEHGYWLDEKLIGPCYGMWPYRREQYKRIKWLTWSGEWRYWTLVREYDIKKAQIEKTRTLHIICIMSSYWTMWGMMLQTIRNRNKSQIDPMKSIIVIIWLHPRCERLSVLHKSPRQPIPDGRPSCPAGPSWK